MNLLRNVIGVALRRGPFLFAVMCVLAGSEWILPEFLPASRPLAFQTLINHALLSIAFLVAGRRWPGRQLLGHAAVVFAIPVALVNLADGALSNTAEVLIYTLVPAATVFFVAQREEIEFLRLLAGCMAGVAGAGLLLPFTLPTSAEGWKWLGILVISAVSAGWSSVQLYTAARGQPIARVGAAVSISIAIASALVLAATRPRALYFSLNGLVYLAVDSGVIVLTASLLGTFAPIRFASRLLLIPLVTVLEGFVLLRPETTWTLALGLLLMTAACVLLLREGKSGAEYDKVPENPHAPEIH